MLAFMSTPAWIWENFFRHVSPFIYTMLIVSLFPAFSRSARRRFVAKTAKILAGSRIAPDFVSPRQGRIAPFHPPRHPHIPISPYPNIFCGALPRKKSLSPRKCTALRAVRAARQQERAARIARNSSGPFRTHPLGRKRI